MRAPYKSILGCLTLIRSQGTWQDSSQQSPSILTFLSRSSPARILGFQRAQNTPKRQNGDFRQLVGGVKKTQTMTTPPPARPCGGTRGEGTVVVLADAPAADGREGKKGLPTV